MKWTCGLMGLARTPAAFNAWQLPCHCHRPRRATSTKPLQACFRKLILAIPSDGGQGRGALATARSESASPSDKGRRLTDTFDRHWPPTRPHPRTRRGTTTDAKCQVPGARLQLALGIWHVTLRPHGSSRCYSLPLVPVVQPQNTPNRTRSRDRCQ